MPALNAYWAKYGCTKCNNYKLLVIEFNPGLGTKTNYKSQYLDKYDVKYPAVWASDGGEKLSAAVGNDLAGNPEYLIKPDKTFLQKFGPMTKSLVDAAGGNVQHVCNTGVCTAPEKTGSPGVSIHSLTAGRLQVTVRDADEYRIAVHTADGRLVSGIKARLAAGSNGIRLPEVSASAQVMVVSVSGKKGAVAHRVILND